MLNASFLEIGIKERFCSCSVDVIARFLGFIKPPDSALEPARSLLTVGVA